MKKLLAAFVAAALLANTAAASPASEAYVGELIDELHQSGMVSEADLIVDSVDMPRVSRFVLGKYAREASAEDSKLFEARFDRFLRDFLSSRSEELSNAELVVVSSSDRADTDSIVTTRVSSATREPMTMRWRVLLRDGEWRLVDVEVHGLWLAIEQRAQVTALLGDHGMPIRDLYLVAAAD